MRIHIVQKGDTLWEIAKKYSVDFEQLKQLNSQLSSPDMIMPGMKIKIPSSSKPVKKEMKKETKKETIKEMPKAEHPYKSTSPKPIKVIKEDDVKETKKVKVEKPTFQVPTMPILDTSLPEIPKEKPIKAPKEQKKKEVQKPKVPPKEEQVPPKEMPSPEKELPEYAPPQMMPMMPVCHYVHPCCCHMHHPFAPVAGHMYGGMMHPCPHHMHHHHHMMQHQDVGGMVQGETPTMHMPQDDCGCGGSTAYNHHPGYQVPVGGVPNNHYEQSEAQPTTLPFPMHPSHQSFHPYPTPPVPGGPPSFADLGMRLNEDENKSEE